MVYHREKAIIRKFQARASFTCEASDGVCTACKKGTSGEIRAAVLSSINRFQYVLRTT